MYMRKDSRHQERKESPAKNKAARILAIAFLILFFGGGGGAFLYFSLRQPPKTFSLPLPGGNDPETVQRTLGYNMARSLMEKSRAGIVFTFGANNTPILTLVLDDPREDWTGKNAASQKSMCIYIQWLIPQAQTLTSLFIPQGRDNPRYAEIFHNVRANLCRSCWAVADSDGRYYVAGDRAWQSLDDSTGVETWLELQTRAGR